MLRETYLTGKFRRKTPGLGGAMRLKKKRAVTTTLGSIVAVVVALGAPGCGGGTDQGEVQAVSADEIARQKEIHAAEVETWHAERLASLQAEGGWLSLVGLFWLEDGDNTVGSDASAVVRLPESVPASVGTLSLSRTAAGPTVTFATSPELTSPELTGSGELTVEPAVDLGAPITLVSDLHEEPTTLRHGSVSFYLIERGDRVGIRVKDSASAVRTAFAGIERFPVTFDWRLVTEYRPRTEAKTLQIPTAIGTVDDMASPGTIHFEKDGRSFQLDAFEGSDAQEVWFVFGDLTNAKTTYGGGRFLYSRFTDGDASQAGSLVVDFNRAYNPPCVFTPYATCPLPTLENRLDIAVEAGEKVWGKH